MLMIASCMILIGGQQDIHGLTQGKLGIEVVEEQKGTLVCKSSANTVNGIFEFFIISL